MKNFDANACIGAFFDLCEELALTRLISVDECQYWVFEQGYQSATGSLAEFSRLCDTADNSNLVSSIDCEYWLFERGHLAAIELSTNIDQHQQQGITELTNASSKVRAEKAIYALSEKIGAVNY